MRKVFRLVLILIIIVAIVLVIVLGFSATKTDKNCGFGCTIEFYPPNLLKEALKNKNPNVCNASEGGVFQDIQVSKDDSVEMCKSDFATATKNVDLCKQLRKRGNFYEARDKCLERLANKLKMPELCDEMIMSSGGSDENWKQNIIQKCKNNSKNLLEFLKTLKIF